MRQEYLATFEFLKKFTRPTTLNLRSQWDLSIMSTVTKGETR